MYILWIILFLVFISLWFFKRRKTKMNSLRRNINQSNLSSNKLPNHESSKFRDWLLREGNVTDSDQLPKELRDAFLMDDWSKLSPDLYSKWSKYHWGL